MSSRATESSLAGQGGFAMLVLLAVIGVGSVGVLLAVQAMVPMLGERQAVADQHLEVVAATASNAFRQNGVFPTDLDDLAIVSGLAAAGGWRRDPFGSGQELDYQIIASGVRVRSRGADGRLGTADDNTTLIATETQLRLRQRLRLRMLRAVLLRSAYRYDGLMTAGHLAQMRDAMRNYASAKRRWLTADSAARLTLTATMVAAAASVNSLVTNYSLPSLPVALAGAGGLMSQLGMSDLRAVDGQDAPLLMDPVVGWLAAGNDGLGGTNDDM